MKYQNTKTGVIISTPCKISGDNWVKWVEPDIKEPENEEIKEEKETPETKENDFDGITIKQIKQELDAFGIEYNPKAKKQELYDLMIKGR